MNVLVVSHHTLPHVGGLEVLVDKEVRVLAREGHRVVHVTSDLGGAGHLADYPPSATLIRIATWNPIEKYLHLAYPIFSVRLIQTLWRETRRADVVHVHGFIYLSSLVGMLIAALQRRPRILTDHGAIQRYHSSLATFAARAACETIGRLNCLLATRLIAYNPRVLDVLKRFNRGRCPAAFVPYPVDPTMFHRVSTEERRALREKLDWPDRPPTVLFVGRLNPDKGADLLVRAADPAHFRTVICGPGDRGILGDLCGRDDVTVLDPRPQTQVRELFQAADVVAVPTVPGREGFPLVVREALACGTPVVLAYEPGYEPYRQRGLRFVNRTAHDLRAGLIEALNDQRDWPLADVDPELTPSENHWIARIYSCAASDTN